MNILGDAEGVIVTNFTIEQAGTAKADSVCLPACRVRVAVLRNDEVRTLGQELRWMHGPLDALARDASNRIVPVVRRAEGRYGCSSHANSPESDRFDVGGRIGCARLSTVKTHAISCIVRSLRVTLA